MIGMSLNMDGDQGQQVLLALKGIYAVIDEQLAQTNVLLAAILDATNFKNAAPAGGIKAEAALTAPPPKEIAGLLNRLDRCLVMVSGATDNDAYLRSQIIQVIEVLSAPPPKEIVLEQRIRKLEAERDEWKQRALYQQNRANDLLDKPSAYGDAIRSKMIEECAIVAEEFRTYVSGTAWIMSEIAIAIRALAQSERTNETNS